MLRLPPFRYYAPRSLDDALRILSDHGPEAQIVAGGTDLYPKMKRRQIEPRVLVGVRSIPELSRITWMERDGVTLGAGITLARVLAHEDLAVAYPALARACAVIAHPPIRSMGTIGGNLCVDTRCTYYDQTFFWREALGFCLKKDGTVCPVAPGGDAMLGRLLIRWSPSDDRFGRHASTRWPTWRADDRSRGVLSG